MKNLKYILIFLNLPRFVLHIILCLISKNRDVIISDIKKALEHHSISVNLFHGFLYLLSFDSYFRNVFYYRIGLKSYICRWLAKPNSNFIIGTYTSIGKGFLAIHPFSTIINAKSIGDNFVVKNNITIGSSNKGLPIIKNNVEVNVGAIVIGDVVLGNNVVVGAGAVVTKDVSDNCVVVGNPAYIIREDGIRVKKTL